MYIWRAGRREDGEPGPGGEASEASADHFGRRAGPSPRASTSRRSAGGRRPTTAARWACSALYPRACVPPASQPPVAALAHKAESGTPVAHAHSGAGSERRSGARRMSPLLGGVPVIFVLFCITGPRGTCYLGRVLLLRLRAAGSGRAVVRCCSVLLQSPAGWPSTFHSFGSLRPLRVELTRRRRTFCFALAPPDSSPSLVQSTRWTYPSFSASLEPYVVYIIAPTFHNSFCALCLITGLTWSRRGVRPIPRQIAALSRPMTCYSSA